MKDDLGNRMKENYENRTRFSLPRRSYTVIRIDGKAFHTYTRGLIIPFEYKGKDEFVYDVLKRFDKKFFKEHSHAELFGEWLSDQDISDIEHNVFTLEEWFGRDKQKPFVL